MKHIEEDIGKEKFEKIIAKSERCGITLEEYVYILLNNDLKE